jgi:hypothetical protein
MQKEEREEVQKKGREQVKKEQGSRGEDGGRLPTVMNILHGEVLKLR